MAGFMFFQRYRLRWSFILLVVLAVAGLFLSALHRLEFDFDLVASLPQDDPVLADARRILASHPIQDRLVIDVGLPGRIPRVWSVPPRRSSSACKRAASSPGSAWGGSSGSFRNCSCTSPCIFRSS